jgi:hypothetical protein
MRTNISATQVADGLKLTLQTYLHGFVAEQERLEGRPARELPIPGDVVIGSDSAVVRPEDEFPIVYVQSAGLASPPDRVGFHNHNLEYGIVVGVFIIGDDIETLHQTLRSYVAAMRFCVLTKRVQGLDCSVSFVDEAYDLIGGERTRSMVGGEVGIAVFVENAISLGDDPFPAGPPVDPYQLITDGPAVLTTNVDIKEFSNV